MKHSLYIDQLTLEHWIGKKLDPKQMDGDQSSERNRYLRHTFDLTDAALVAFIADMNPQDEAVKSLMYQGYFLLKLEYIAERLPLLQMDERGIYRRLRWLRLMGILESKHRTVDGNKTLAYYRLSALYWKIHHIRHEQATRAAKKATEAMALEGDRAIAPVDHGSGKSHSPCGQEPWPVGAIKASQEMHSSSPAAPPPAGGSEAPPPAVPSEDECQEGRDGVKRDSLGPVPAGPDPSMVSDEPTERDPRVGKSMAQLLLKIGDPLTVARVCERNPDLGRAFRLQEQGNPQEIGQLKQQLGQRASEAVAV